MKRTIKFGVAALAALTLFGLNPGAAHATAGVAVFQGTANVTPGLAFPVISPNPPGNTGTWNISTSSCNAVGAGGLAGCSLNMSGTLGAVAGFGPACGISSGAGGGTFTENGNSHTAAVTWPTSAGTIIPLIGSYGGHGSGTLVSLVRASAGATPVDTVTQCLAGSATTFSVLGVAVLIGS